MQAGSGYFRLSHRKDRRIGHSRCSRTSLAYLKDAESGLMNMDKTTKGAWIVHHTAKLQQVVNIGPYEGIATAGKAGRLLSSMAATQQAKLSRTQVDSFARVHGIAARTEVPTLLHYLDTLKLVQVSGDFVEVLGLTQSAVLSHTADLFDSLNPASEESAVISLAEDVSNQPSDKTSTLERLADTFKLNAGRITDLAAQAESIGFVDHEHVDSSTTLYFNGNIFRRERAAQANAILRAVNAVEAAQITELSNLLAQRGCIDVLQATTLVPEALFWRLVSIGMFDLNEVANTGERVQFVTRPAAFGKYGNPFSDDALDLAKAFVTCLTYGMKRSAPSRGQIQRLDLLMRNLIAGDWVGPATAIGEDYKLLELRGVIQTRPQGYGYSMKLLKKDIGEIALAVLTQGDASHDTAATLPGASVSSYSAPEQNRTVIRKKETPGGRRATAELLLAIRTGR